MTAAGVWTYTLDNNNPAVQALNGAATLTDTFNVLTVDGTAQVVTIIINAMDDPAVAVDDAFATDEATPIFGGNVFAANPTTPDSDPDGPALAVTEVNGIAVDVGVVNALASGALLTLNANGTFDYDPFGAFDALPGPASGASNLTDTDTFTYTVTGGDTATVTVTIRGLDSNGDVLQGTAGADTLNGGIGADTMQGGASNDIYLVDDANDAIIEGAGEGVLDRLYASVSYGLAAGVGIEWMATANSLATTPIDLTGNELANRNLRQCRRQHAERRRR